MGSVRVWGVLGYGGSCVMRGVRVWGELCYEGC